MRDILPSLVMQGQIESEDEIYQKLLQISAATVDRLLAEQRAKRKPQGNTHAKPTSLLKAVVQLPCLRTAIKTMKREQLRRDVQGLSLRVQNLVRF